MSRKIPLTINQASPISTRPIAACFRIVNPDLYWSSLPAAVTILNHHHNTTIKAINAIIPNTRLTNQLMTFANESSCHLSVPTKLISSTGPDSSGLVKGLLVISIAAKPLLDATKTDPSIARISLAKHLFKICIIRIDVRIQNALLRESVTSRVLTSSTCNLDHKEDKRYNEPSYTNQC